MNSVKSYRWIIAALLALFIAGCGPDKSSSPAGAGDIGSTPSLVIASGSENKSLEPLVQQFATQNHVQIQMNYLGSVDMMLRLQNGTLAADAVWPANSLWVDLGDTKKQVKDQESIFRTPVVLGVKKSVAQKLGWVGHPVHVADILRAAESGKFKYMMTSASQSNSGASAYIGYLYAFAGRPEILTEKNLHDPTVQTKVKHLLQTVNRSAGSSGWLKDLFLQKYDQFDGMVNYEALMIEANQALTTQGREPLYVIYPVDGLTVADSPLGYVDRGNAAKAQVFSKLQAYLLSAPVQAQILAQGRRTGLIGLSIDHADPAVFNPAWGIDATRSLAPLRFPESTVIRDALDLYQTALRKPSFTVYCLDFSGSMEGTRAASLKAALQSLLDQQAAKQQFLQASKDDVTIILPFNSDVLQKMQVIGDDPKALSALLAQVEALRPDGGTDIYAPVMQAFDLMKQHGHLDKYFPAVILMTDGESNTDRFSELDAFIPQENLGTDVPVFAIKFGDADPAELQQITDRTSGQLFDGTQDLTFAFRQAKGYN